MDSALMDLLLLPYPHLCKNSIASYPRNVLRAVLNDLKPIPANACRLMAQ